MSEYVCTDCGHSFDNHDSVIVPWGCTVVDATSVDCVNGYQGERPPEQMPVRMEGVGWISQFLLPGSPPAGGSGWVSWTQWKRRAEAETHVRRFLANQRTDYLAGRVVRVDWTIAATFQREANPIVVDMANGPDRTAEIGPPKREGGG